MGSYLGALKGAATRIGVSLEVYLEKRRAGLKSCHQCRRWLSIINYHTDVSRGDGLCAACIECRSSRSVGPTKHERQQRRLQGESWCRGCQAWLPLEKVRKGTCRPCKNADDRKRYATDPHYRFRRRQHTRSRARNILPVPPEGQEVLEERFGGQCAYCGQPTTTHDHIIPVSRGGNTTPGNMVLACKSCNSSKKDTEDVLAWLEKKRLPGSPGLFNTLLMREVGLYG